MINFITNTLGPWSTVVTLVVSVPVFWTWWETVFGRRRRNQRWLEQARGWRGRQPAVLIVDISDRGSIRAQVEAYVRSDIGNIPNERIVEIAIPRMVTDADMSMIHEEIQEKVGRLHHLGTDVVHCFLRAPVLVSAMVGAALGNAMQVNLYHNQQTGYKNWGPLRHTPEYPP